ncbi:hypothetical protein N7448_003055 [Penicillium atrosanguineum]|uniref:GroES-like protein n=1 Tax=Penicillium atrosanguineum TaxID=1132637 RepID=UPI0023824C8F|nr:GroES-like protein [Penicillium atrosanguineum]KAJ5121922.1 hypothetical protein N7526_008859 [Penicillium atrosanguineum]KAJ5139647.1 hypothetical protein N7448_003055 [Penicillium atrosanguineum]KAJ5309570.1 GroES-like protein [Penicillium atrosanguineum]
MNTQILKTITRRPRGTIAHLTVSRPSKLNALNTSLLLSLSSTLKFIESSNKDLLAVVLTGAGPKSFIGGADIAEMASLDSPFAAREFISKVSDACSAVRNCPVPVIARVNGYALGAGLEIAACCDLRIASRNAVFGMPEVRVGIPSVVEAALLPGLIGWGRTRRLLMLGENIGAEEALNWGLVEKVVETEELDDAVEGWLGLLEGNGPLAVRKQKALMRIWEDSSLDQAIRAGVDAFGESFVTDAQGETEPKRMMGAFLKGKGKRS